MVTNIAVIRQNVFNHAKVMVVGVSGDLKKNETQKFSFDMTLRFFHTII